MQILKAVLPFFIASNSGGVTPPASFIGAAPQIAFGTAANQGFMWSDGATTGVTLSHALTNVAGVDTATQVYGGRIRLNASTDFLVIDSQSTGLTPGVAANPTSRMLWAFGSYCQINDRLVLNVPAAAGSETLWTLGITDDAVSSLTFINGITTANRFAPTIRGLSDTAADTGLTLQGTVSATRDTGTQPVFVLNAFRVDGAKIATRPTFAFYAYDTAIATVSAKGAWTFNILSTASAAESLMTWGVSDDANGKLELVSGSTTDGKFVPNLKGTGDSSGLYSLTLTAIVNQDTGALGGMLFRSHTGASAVLTTRPLCEWQNWTTTVLTLVPISSGTTAALNFGITGSGAPTFTTRSAGNKVILRDSVTGSVVDIALGMTSSVGPWLSMNDGSNSRKTIIYGGVTNVWQVDGVGHTTNTACEDHKTRVALTSPVTVSGNSDYYVESNLSVAGAVAVNLPASPPAGLTYIIKDGKGDANVNNITITPAAGTIDGAATKVINTAYGAVSLIYNGTQWTTW